MKKRIVIFSTAYFPYVGGAEVSIRELAKRSPEYEFELVTARFDADLPHEEKIDNVLVHRVGFGSRFDKMLLPFLGTLRVLSIVRKRQVDMFWAVMVTFASGIPYIVNMLRLKKKRIPVVLTLQEGDSEEHINTKRFGVMGFLWRFVMLPVSLLLPKVVREEKHAQGMIQLAWRLALSRSDYVTVLSTYLEERARHYGYEGPLEVIPNGVDVAFYSRKPSPESLARLEKKLKKKKDEHYLITVSRLVKKNAVDDVIRALVYLPKTLKFIVVGVGPDAEDLFNLAHELGVEQRVAFVGWDGHETLLDYFALSDIFIRPSLSEGFGISFVEAMASRVPVIATPVGGIPDFLTDRETGLFCEVRNPKSIAEQVQRLLDDTKLRKHVTEKAFTMVQERYDWDTLALDMKEKVFDKVMREI